MFAMDRIRLVTPTDLTFRIPEGFSVEEYMSGCFKLIHDERAHVRVRFTGRAARWVADRQWHPSQTIEAENDGGITASFDVGGTSEIKCWILGFGPLAEVLEPERLRQEVAEAAARMAAMYRGGTVSPLRSGKR